MIQPKPKRNMIEVDLTGTEGNAFYILALARRLSNQLKIDFDPIHKEMVGGNYENLIKIFDKHFGQHVILYTTKS